ncbi:hypothetical protein Poli38472_006744 [Pythium oligandrum]|uniref:Uncharacterized protein n=1 Tax=Pythium oligandrum TaxID=41045 RepID=A0A8K1C5B3_PYTOL|nr:hypothetical protein Poli38472_006744 [Pythium oligandrum]|eukprot:TMW56734.1 hypothetical protein Poli38472_006744 [Pythium oligandrum]
MADNGRRKQPMPQYLAQQAMHQHHAHAHHHHAQQQAAKSFGGGGQGPNAAAGRYPRDRAPPRGPANQPRTPPVTSKMGIKSGMTVEDLKRLTQQRIQQTTGQDPMAQRPVTPTPVQTPTLNMAAVNTSVAAAPTSTTPVVPKAGMSVQELKQLTSLRLASQNVPLHQSEITGLVSKAVLSNAAKSHYRESLRGSVTPTTTPRRTLAGSALTPRGTSGPSNVSSPMHDPMASRHSMPSRPLGVPAMRNSLTGTKPMDFSDSNQMRYSYPGPEDYAFDLGGDSNSSQETDQYVRPSLDFEDEGKYRFDDFHFPDDAFPPPPPLDENGGFVATSLPSWSPPPARSKKLDVVPPAVHFTYPQQPSYFSQQQTREDVSRDQNAIIAPPPGLSRRPSMTVPWQVAEAVLNTPQTTTTTGRKTLTSPTGANDISPEVSNMFAMSSNGMGRGMDSASLKSPAAQAAAELSAMSLSRQSRGPTASGASTTVASPLGTSPAANGARRGSFGNAAEFFKFRRRSKSRLELARDISNSYASSEGSGNAFPNYGATGGVMPGIDESRVDFLDNFSVVAHADTNSTTSNDESVLSPGFDDEDVVRVDDVYEDSEGGGSFVSFYNATGAGRHNREGPSGLSSLSIPPPPPPPLTDDDDEGSTTSSSKGLPMMSPNGVRLRKVAEMARRGSLSNEDKTRVKDEIIQSSLGIGASNAARILTAKPGSSPSVGIPGDRPPVSPPAAGTPPPGFSRLSSTPPRNTPKSTGKSLGPGGIVRTTGKMLSPNSAAAPSRKTIDGGETSGTLEERLAAAAQRVADCVSKGDMIGFQQAMDELDRLRNEANGTLLRG